MTDHGDVYETPLSDDASHREYQLKSGGQLRNQFGYPMCRICGFVQQGVSPPEAHGLGCWGGTCSAYCASEARKLAGMVFPPPKDPVSIH